MRLPYKLAVLCRRLREKGPVRFEAQELRACCPAHDDKHPSLYVALTEDLTVLLRCRADCTAAAITQAVDLTPADLFCKDDPWVEVDDQFEITAEEVAPDPTVFHTPGAKPAVAAQDGDLCHLVYSMFLDLLTLSDDHRQALRDRKLPDEEIDRRLYRTLDAFTVHQAVGRLRDTHSDEELGRVPGFANSNGKLTFPQSGLKGLLIPVRRLDGNLQALKVRLDSGDPRYLWVSSTSAGGPSPGSPCDVPLGITAPLTEVRLTEGPLKADAAFTLSGLPTVGVAGISNWRPALEVLSTMQAREVIISYDMDGKKATYQAAEALAFALDEAGFLVQGEVWDDAERN